MKRGITLTILVIIVIVLAILATTVAFSAGEITKTSNLSNFATNMSKIQDAATNYYITRGKLPIIENLTVFTKNDLLSHVGAVKSANLSTEISENGDEGSTFYYLDVEKINITNLPFGITTTSRSLIINNEGTHVYFLDGYEINGVWYFSVTKDLK